MKGSDWLLSGQQTEEREGRSGRPTVRLLQSQVREHSRLAQGGRGGDGEDPGYILKMELIAFTN